MNHGGHGEHGDNAKGTTKSAKGRMARSLGLNVGHLNGVARNEPKVKDAAPLAGDEFTWLDYGRFESSSRLRHSPRIARGRSLRSSFLADCVQGDRPLYAIASFAPFVVPFALSPARRGK